MGWSTQQDSSNTSLTGTLLMLHLHKTSTLNKIIAFSYQKEEWKERDKE